MAVYQAIMAFTNWMWTFPILALLIGGGLVITVACDFVQIKHFGYMLKATFGDAAHSKSEEGISSWSAMVATLANTIGTGNIIGVGSAIALGGPGAVFWMWVIGFVAMAPTTAVIDANDGMGMVASKKAMDMCIEKAHKYGMGMVAVRNSSHYGIAGYWTGLATKENMIGISGTNARPSVAPTFGVENMLGTNPLTFSMPTDEPFPFMLDCATSVIQNGKIEYYARIGHDTPKGLVISREGEELTDSVEILKKIRSKQAALAPLGGFGETNGGYKGYGYSTVVEILSAALQSGIFLRALEGKNEDGSIRPYHLGHFFIAIDTEAFMGAEAFKKTCGDILRDLRGSEKAPGQERIYTAGEKEYDVWMYRKDKGVPVTEAVQKEFIGLRDEFGLTQFKFPFEK